LIRLPVRSSAAISQPFQSAVFVSLEDLVAGLARDIELAAQHRHLLAVEQAGYKSKSFVHLATLLPRHFGLPKGLKCYPCVRKEVLPLSREGHDLTPETTKMKIVLVPLMIFASSTFMAAAWLGHLRIRDKSFWIALALSWSIVLPEYILNVAATRYGYGTYTGAQMAAFHLVSGVVCVALVAYYILGETFSSSQLVGFALLAVGMILILAPASE
jgi:uncharacterized protein